MKTYELWELPYLTLGNGSLLIPTELIEKRLLFNSDAKTLSIHGNVQEHVKEIVQLISSSPSLCMDPLEPTSIQQLFDSAGLNLTVNRVRTVETEPSLYFLDCNEGKVQIRSFNEMSLTRFYTIQIGVRSEVINSGQCTAIEKVTVSDFYVEFPSTIPNQSIHLYLVYEKNGQHVDNTYLEVSNGLLHEHGVVRTINDLVHSMSEEKTSFYIDYFEAISELERSNIPQLYGTIEFSRYLGWEKTRLSTMLGRLERGGKIKLPLPKPIARLSSTPVWTYEQVYKFKQYLDGQK